MSVQNLEREQENSQVFIWHMILYLPRGTYFIHTRDSEKCRATWQKLHVPSLSGVRYTGACFSHLVNHSMPWHQHLQLSHSSLFPSSFFSWIFRGPFHQSIVIAAGVLGLFHSLPLGGKAILVHSPLMIPAAMNLSSAFKNIPLSLHYFATCYSTWCYSGTAQKHTPGFRSLLDWYAWNCYQSTTSEH